MKVSARVVLPVLISLAIWVGSASAQLINQTLNLRQGWTAVFLEVDPEPADCDSIFGGTPVESVWTWNKRFTTVQFIQDPNTLLPGQPDWLTYLRPNDPGRATVNLFLLQGGKPYLIKSSAAATLTVRGRPAVRAANWLADSFNLAGFYVSASAPPTFQALLAPSAALAGQPVYRLSATGTWQPVISPSSTTVPRGESFWIHAGAYSTYSGLLQVTFEQGSGLDFGQVSLEQTLRIRNTSSSSSTFTLTRAASVGPPSTNYPALAGDVPLSYWQMNLAANQAGFVALPATLVSPAIAPGGDWSIRLAVRRADMTPFNLPAGYSKALYQALLKVTDGKGSDVNIPVSSEGLKRYGTPGLAGRGGSFAPPATVDPRAGLWVGGVALTNVSQPAVSDVPVPTATEFQFRVLLHVDGSGNTRLLQKVVLAWTNGVVVTNALGFRQAVSPGRFALLTDEGLISKFSGSSLRDGSITGQRISSAAFSFREPILADQSGAFGEANSLVTCVVPLPYNDPLNPFLHIYHPDHNNLDERYEQVAPECPNITREVAFLFTAQDPERTTLPGWGDNQLGGVYSESITGLHKSAIKVQGTFRLYRASTVASLNDLSF